MQISLSDFPILKNGSLVYLDSAATSLKPTQVIDSVVSYYKDYPANIHRGIYKISEKATQKYEQSREIISKFIGATSPDEVIFVRNTTEAINLVSRAWGEINLKRGDKVICSVTEHHSNLLPWQRLVGKSGIEILYLDVDENGQISFDQLEEYLSVSPRLVTINHVSNVLGTINDVEKISKMVRQLSDAKVLVDGAQAAPHLPLDVASIGCDFYAFSGHKMLGPTGIGVLWVNRAVWGEMEPFLVGGGMIREVNLEGAVFDDFPYMFEAGTPNIAGAIGLGEAVSYLSKIGMDNIFKHESKLSDYAIDCFNQMKYLKIYGPKGQRSGVISFSVDGLHPHDLASILDEENIAIRAGHHCCMPLHKVLGVPATARASFYVYNTKYDIDRLVDGIEKAKKMFG